MKEKVWSPQIMANMKEEKARGGNHGTVIRGNRERRVHLQNHAWDSAREDLVGQSGLGRSKLGHWKRRACKTNESENVPYV